MRLPVSVSVPVPVPVPVPAPACLYINRRDAERVLSQHIAVLDPPES